MAQSTSCSCWTRLVLFYLILTRLQGSHAGQVRTHFVRPLCCSTAVDYTLQSKNSMISSNGRADSCQVVGGWSVMLRGCMGTSLRCASHCDSLRRSCGLLLVGPGPYLPKPREIYESMEIFTRPKRPDIVTSNDDAYWKAVRQATAPCFSISNLKQVGVGTALHVWCSAGC